MSLSLLHVQVAISVEQELDREPLMIVQLGSTVCPDKESLINS
jgi:hypothetical protein